MYVELWQIAVFLAFYVAFRVWTLSRQMRRAREVERFETIMDFLPEDEHARIMRCLDMRNVTGRLERARVATVFGGKALADYVKRGYKAAKED